MNEKTSKEIFSELYNKYYSRLFYYAYSFIEDTEVCRDIVSDVFGKAWEEAEKLKPSTIGNFLYSCVRNRCVDYLRHAQAERQYIDSLQDVMEQEEEMTVEELEERLKLVKQVISELPPRTRFILEQCYFHNKKYREVADILEITPDAIKKHMMKAFSILRERLSVIKI